MPEFLSSEWIAALAVACRDAAERDDGTEPLVVEPLVVEPVVLDVPERGEVRYRISFGETSVGVDAGPADHPPADVRLETDYVTAVGLARGDTNAQAALAGGRLRVSGDVARLAAHGSALARLGDLFGALRSTTTYPEPSGPAR